MRILSIIPARGGSKTLPRKNIKLFNEHPLIYWSILPSLNAKLITKTIVSTDDEEIANTAKQYSDIVPFLRPASLAQDSSSSVSLVIHALDYFEQQDEYFDAILLLQPTSPLRTASELDEMISHFTQNQDDFDALVAVVTSLTPHHAKTIENQKLVPLFPDFKHISRRQDAPPSFAPCGMGYLTKVETLRKTNSFYPERTLGWVVDNRHRYDIDDQYDFIAAESVHKACYDAETQCYKTL